MRAWRCWTAVALLWVMVLGGCAGESGTVTGTPPSVTELEFKYSVRFANSDGGYVVKRVEYADEYGVVREVRNPLPLWTETLVLRPGDRMYVRAETDYDGAFWSAVQVIGPDGRYRSDACERVDGPGTCVVVIDERVE